MVTAALPAAPAARAVVGGQGRSVARVNFTRRVSVAGGRLARRGLKRGANAAAPVAALRRPEVSVASSEEEVDMPLATTALLAAGAVLWLGHVDPAAAAQLQDQAAVGRRSKLLDG